MFKIAMRYNPQLHTFISNKPHQTEHRNSQTATPSHSSWTNQSRSTRTHTSPRSIGSSNHPNLARQLVSRNSARARQFPFLLKHIYEVYTSREEHCFDVLKPIARLCSIPLRFCYGFSTLYPSCINLPYFGLPRSVEKKERKVGQKGKTVVWELAQWSKMHGAAFWGTLVVEMGYSCGGDWRSSRKIF